MRHRVPQSAAHRQRQHVCTVAVVGVHVEPEQLEARGFGRPGQFHVAKQRAVATQAAARAQRFGQHRADHEARAQGMATRSMTS